MISRHVVKPVALAILGLVCGGSARPLEGQSRGVLQATARVVDYGTSLAALKTLSLAVITHGLGQQGPIGGPRIHLDTAPNPVQRPEPIVVTINYLQ
jgi:hypothetical protein